MENISKFVVTLDDGKRIGYVLNVAVDFDSMNLLGYYVVDEETETELLVRLDDIKTISKDIVFVEDGTKFEFVPEAQSSLIGKDVYDEKGVWYGQIIGLDFFKGKCVKLITNKCDILTKYIKSIGEDTVFIFFKKKKKSQKIKVFQKNSAEIVVKTQMSQNVQVPEKITLSNKFYVGKISNQDILGYNNERIVSKGETISKEIVEKAKKHNKLNQLFFAIKR